MHKILIDNIINDFKDFFIPEKHSKFIKYRWIDDMPGGMKVIRTGKKSFLAISSDIKCLGIDNDISKLYVLFIIGHELAHLVNKHLNYKDKDIFDSQTIEMWADFFGAKITMSILQNGTRFNKMLDADFKDVNIGLEIIFHTLLELNQKVHINTNSSRKYINSSERSSTIVAGIIAFLTRKEMILNLKLSEQKHAEIGFDWGVTVNKKLYELGFFEKLFSDKTKDDIDIAKMASNVFTIHQSLKQKNGQLLKGLDPYHMYILDTSYEEHKPNKLMIEKFNHYFDDLGWNLKI